MEFSAKKIAEFLNGQIEGNPDVVVNTISAIDNGKPGSLTFLTNMKYEKYLYTTQSSIVLVHSSFSSSKKIPATLIKVDDPYNSLATLLELYQSLQKKPAGKHPKCLVEESAYVPDDAYIGAFSLISGQAVIGKGAVIYSNVFIGNNVKVGENTVIRPGVKVYADCVIGSNCVIHSNTVIGADGFGFAPQKENEIKKIPQLGNVVIEDNVEIGANCSIDRATLGTTRICRGAKLDNLIQIAHNCEIGENTVIAAQTGISGSSKIGRNCMIGGQVGIAGHLTIADNVKIAAQSGIGCDILVEGSIVQGSPAYQIKSYQKSYVLFKKLPELMNRIDSLETELNSLKELKNK